MSGAMCKKNAIMFAHIAMCLYLCAMIRAILDPDSPEGKCEKFASDNYHILQRLYPGKWVVFVDCSCLFTADSAEEMFEKAESLGMKRGSYYYRHVQPQLRCVEFPSSLGI